jgi:hypothetical protein
MRNAALTFPISSISLSRSFSKKDGSAGDGSNATEGLASDILPDSVVDAVVSKQMNVVETRCRDAPGLNEPNAELNFDHSLDRGK